MPASSSSEPTTPWPCVFAAWASSVAKARYHDIVPDQRSVSTYDMYLAKTRISVSLATVEFKYAVAGTRLICTEQGVFLDGYDKPAERERGTVDLLDQLSAELRRQSANA